MWILVGKCRYDQGTQTVTIEEEGNLRIGHLDNSQDIPVEVFYLGASSRATRIAEPTHIYKHYLVLLLDKELSNVFESS